MEIRNIDAHYLKSLMEKDSSYNKLLENILQLALDNFNKGVIVFEIDYEIHNTNRNQVELIINELRKRKFIVNPEIFYRDSFKFYESWRLEIKWGIK